MTKDKQEKGQYYCPEIYVISIPLEKGFAGSDDLNGQLQNPTDGGYSGTWE